METPKGGKELSPETLRTFKGFENSNDNEAKEQIQVIRKLARILIYLSQNEQTENETNSYENE